MNLRKFYGNYSSGAGEIVNSDNLVSLGVLNASIIVIPPIPAAVANKPLTKPICGEGPIFFT